MAGAHSSEPGACTSPSEGWGSRGQSGPLPLCSSLIHALTHQCPHPASVIGRIPGILPGLGWEDVPTWHRAAAQSWVGLASLATRSSPQYAQLRAASVSCASPVPAVLCRSSGILCLRAFWGLLSLQWGCWASQGWSGGQCPPKQSWASCPCAPLAPLQPMNQVSCLSLSHTHTHSHMHIHAHSYTHTDMLTQTHTHVHTYTGTHSHKYTQRHRHTHSHIYTHRHCYTLIHTHSLSYTHRYTHNHTFTHTCSYTHAHTDTHTLSHTHIDTHTHAHTDTLSLIHTHRLSYTHTRAYTDILSYTYTDSLMYTHTVT